MVQHRKQARDGNQYPLYNAMRKHKTNIVVDKVVIGDVEYCLNIEKSLRPELRIGWNIAIGGAATMLGTKLSEEAKKRIGDCNRGRVPSAETRAAISMAHKGRKYPKEFADECRRRAIERGGFLEEYRRRAYEVNRTLPPWRNSHAVQEVWLLADSVYKVVSGNDKIGVRTLGKIFNMSYGKFLVILKKIRAGWNPSEDESWLIFKNKEKEN